MAQQGKSDFYRRFTEMEEANKGLLNMYSSLLAGHDAILENLKQRDSIVRDGLQGILARLEDILALIDGSHNQFPFYAHAEALVQNSLQVQPPSSGSF